MPLPRIRKTASAEHAKSSLRDLCVNVRVYDKPVLGLYLAGTFPAL